MRCSELANECCALEAVNERQDNSVGVSMKVVETSKTRASIRRLLSGMTKLERRGRRECGEEHSEIYEGGKWR